MIVILSDRCVDRPAAISLEREFTGQSSFTRTISLPQPVDTNNVSAKLEDGVLVVTVPKAEQAGRVKVDIE
jgi:HSP20 family protein